MTDSVLAFYHRVRAVNHTCGQQSAWSPQGKAVIRTPFMIADPDPPPSEWKAGETHAIQWQTNGDLEGKVRIRLFKEGKLHSTIASSASNTGHYDWTIPSGTPWDSEYRIQIAAFKDTAIYAFNKNDFVIGQYNDAWNYPTGPNRPLSYRLEQNFPNPFNHTSMLRYEVPEPSEIRIAVFDAAGRLARSLTASFKTPGWYTIQWNGENDYGEAMPSGVYVIRMTAGRFNGYIKTVMVR